MKALIFGAAGQVGRALAFAAPAEAEVTALGRLECDITDREAVREAVAAVRPDLVFNAAAYTAVDRAEAEPERAALLNADAAGWITEAARAEGARTLYVSTDFVFDGLAGRPYLADDEPHPLSVYGRTKLDGERAVLAADPKALVVRTAWVYSAHGANFVRTMLRLLGERDRLTIVADQIGTPTAAASLGRALWALVKADAFHIHHFTDAGVASWYDFAIAVQEEALAAGLADRTAEIVPIRTQDYPTPARRPAFSVLDKTATWAAIGVPAHWRVPLRACIQEIKERG